MKARRFVPGAAVHDRRRLRHLRSLHARKGVSLRSSLRDVSAGNTDLGDQGSATTPEEESE
jgi:hypothetical protein